MDSLCRVRLRPTNLLALLCLPALPVAFAPWLASAHWLFDLLACFAVQALWCLLPTAAVLILRRRLRLAATFGAGALSAAAACALAAGDGAVAAPHPPANGFALEVFGANLLYGNEGQAGAFLTAVRACNPDVLFLSEVTPAWLEAIDAQLLDYPFRCTRPTPGCFGVALLSRLPLTEATVVPLGYAWSPAVRATVQTAAGPIGLLGVHPPRPGGAERNAERDRGLAALPGLLAGLPPRRVVIGDCNATPFNPTFAAMLEAAGLQNAAGTRWLPSWPQQLPWPLRVPIDHVLVTPTVQVLEIDTGRPFGSDHAPIFAKLTW